MGKNNYKKLFKSLYTINKKAKNDSHYIAGGTSRENLYDIKSNVFSALIEDKKDDKYLKEDKIHLFKYSLEINNPLYSVENDVKKIYGSDKEFKYEYVPYEYLEYKIDHYKYGFHNPIKKKDFWIVKTKDNKYLIIKNKNGRNINKKDIKIFNTKKSLLNFLEKTYSKETKMLNIDETPRKISKNKSVKVLGEAIDTNLNYLKNKKKLRYKEDMQSINPDWYIETFNITNKGETELENDKIDVSYHNIHYKTFSIDEVTKLKKSKYFKNKVKPKK